MPTPDCRLSLMPTTDVGSLISDGDGDDDGSDDGFLLSFDDPDDVLDDVGGAHDDVALGDGGAMLEMPN